MDDSKINYLLWLFLTFVVPSTCFQTDVGVLLMTDNFLPFDMQRIAPAIDMGQRDAEKVFNISFKLILSNYSTDCDGAWTESVGKMAELFYHRNVSVFLGPACSQGVASAGLLAEYMGVPLVTGVGDLLERSPIEKKGYETTTILSYSIDKMSVSMKQILLKYGWRHTAILYDEDEVFFRRVGKNLAMDFRQDDTLNRPYERPFSKSTVEFSSILTEASKFARVFIILSQAHQFRDVMYDAYRQKMANGDYVFITIELFPSAHWGHYTKFTDQSYKDFYKNEYVKRAYESVLVLSLMRQTGDLYNKFKSEVKVRALADYGYTLEESETDNYFIRAFYASVIYLAAAYNKTILEGGDINNGFALARKLWNSTYKVPALDEVVAIDEFGDRIADFDVFDLRDGDSDPPAFEVVGKFFGSTLLYSPVPGVEIKWIKGIPVDVPDCGFTGELCIRNRNVDQMTLIIIVCFLILVIAICIVFIIGYYFHRKNHALYEMKWKINWEHVQFTLSGSAGIFGSFKSSNLFSNNESVRELDVLSTRTCDTGRQMFGTIAYCRGVIVAIRKFSVSSIDLNKKNLLELKQLFSLRHQNVTAFIGACVDVGKVSVMVEYCPKGSLQDILQNESIELDWTFKCSLIQDIMMGMQFLHGSDVKVHGRLSSSACVVDGRFLLKLRCYGPKCFYEVEEKKKSQKEVLNYNKLLWRAPELLRMKEWNPGTQKGDVYSFGIILQEIADRTAPFDSYDMVAFDVVHKVKSGERPPFRPEINENYSESLNLLMTECWSENPDNRPTFDVIVKRFKTIFRGRSNNIMDNLIRRMEQYANNLEGLVEERTKAYVEEKKKAENLLNRMLPMSVAKSLQLGQSVDPETFEEVTIYFSDIVGFTALAARSSPLQVVTLLNDLYTCFDSIINGRRVYKVETIGDAYMVVAGLPERIGSLHAKEIADLSLTIRESVRSFQISHLPNEQLKIRIGAHSGMVVAGVVGLTMPRYCLFGDTVNTASRMESTGEGMKIHISESTKRILETFHDYTITERGETEVKGKGVMKTFWLESKSENDLKATLNNLENHYID
ncbi:atrial natriuretic peptide receptor 1-like [Crassostrea angulata]|uniref:atrial natriuretic peptide receptor 1-like n=1 Tax=Magallana angulata TaxID=2784310 RepID=UPI0022B1B488|nr:atrial natriuretic peptide receptor 1-like [Crassostrea angulata]